MGLFDFWKKNNTDASHPAKVEPVQRQPSREDIYKMILAEQARRTPSDIFASGAVFDLSKRYRSLFIQTLQSGNAMQLYQLFAQIYVQFLDHPEMVGFTAQMVDKQKNDTSPNSWNADLYKFENGDCVALLFMPVYNDKLIARIVGIVFSQRGDGYYYCMLNKDEKNPSDVFRNRAMFGIDKVGEVSGLGFELMNSFRNCVINDFYKMPVRNR